MSQNGKKKINIFIYENIMLYPPTISLIQCLLDNGFEVKLVSQGATSLDDTILKNKKFSYYNVEVSSKKGIISRIARRIQFKKQFVTEFEKINDEEIIWTVNPLVVRTVGKRLLKKNNKHIMQMLELTSTFPLFSKSKKIKFDLKPYAQNAWKVVVPEINRAYIQKVGWKLPQLPYVLPNKPYKFNIEKEPDDIKPMIEIMKKEKRKIIIYLGVIDPDRSFEPFAKAIEKVKDEYVLYMFGKVGDSLKGQLDEFCKKYESVKYMGFVNPPKHLQFLKYARMALVPYSPESMDGYEFDILNALYCAPNKIYEYSGFHIPMIGTDVLGLKEIFEKYNIGVCCKDLNEQTIINEIRYIDQNYDLMTKNSKQFFDDIDIDKIVNNIINDK